MLSDRCLSCPVLFCLFACKVGVLCPNGWTVKMKLGMLVGLSPSHIVLDGDPTPPNKKGHSPHFLAHVRCGQMAGWIKMPLGVEVGLGPGDLC